jgi:hypothetical protein
MDALLVLLVILSLNIMQYLGPAFWPGPLGGLAAMDYARSILEKAAQREEEWLAGDWDSRSARGIDTMYRHRARLDSLTAALAQVVGDRCDYCDKTYPRVAVQSHHHYEPAR